LIILVILAAMAVQASLAQGVEAIPPPAWDHAYGGPSSDVGYSVAPAPDGGFLVIGATRSYGNGSYDAFLLRTGRDGTELWNRTYGGPGGEWCYGIIRTSEGNYLLAGATNSYGSGGFDVWLVMVDEDGRHLWSKTYGGSNADAGFAAIEAREGGFAIAGYRGISAGDSDVYLIRTDAQGNVLWERTYPRGITDWGKAIVQTTDGGFAIAGWTKESSDSKAQAFLLKTDASGTMQWMKTFGGSSGDSYGYGLSETVDRGIALGGYTAAKGNGGTDLYVVKVDEAGNFQWEKTYGGSKDEYGSAIFPRDDGLLIGGHTSSYDPALWQPLLVKADDDGDLAWQRVYKKNNTSVKGGFTAPSDDGGYVFVGHTNEYGSNADDVFVLKLGGVQEAAPADGPDLTARATVTVAAVAAGTGLGLLGLFLGRISDFLSTLAGKIGTFLGGAVEWLDHFLPVEDTYKFVEGYAKTHLKILFFRKVNKIKEAHAQERVPFMAGFSAQELAIIAFSAVLLGIAFMFAKKLSLFQLGDLALFVFMAGFVVSLHDLTHRYFAYRYNTVAEYKFWGFGTLIMFLTAFVFGIVYAVPARTVIENVKQMGPKEQAIVFLSGPLMSAALTILFLALVPVGGAIKAIALLGVSMNVLAAVYSLMPFDPMDGSKVYRWKKGAWALMFVPLMAVYLATAIFL
jgi:Zn-dependent protease